MKYKKWTLEQKLEILSVSEEIRIVEVRRKYSLSTGTLNKFELKGEAGLKVTYATNSKELKESQEENRVRSAARAFKKKVWDVRSKKDLVDVTFLRYNISKAKIIKIVGMVHSSYYRVPIGGKKGNKPSKKTFYKNNGLVS
jgi:putative transposase